MSPDGNIKDISPSYKQSSCYLVDVETDEGTLTFTVCSSYLDVLPADAAQQLLRHMEVKKIKKGERILNQNETGTQWYLILKGSCVSIAEKNNMPYHVTRLSEGDIVGEMVLFPGESSNTYVDAETDMYLLDMSREQFESLSQENPEFSNMLSEILTNRLSRSQSTEERKIGKYSITEKVDHGGSSIIYRGVHSILNLPVAIKMLKHEMAMDQDFIDLLRNEAKIIAQMNHPNIVKVYDIEERFHTVFIIMEYLDGLLLKQMMKNTPNLSLSQIVDITVQVCYGLEYAHHQRIIHQDINPNNIFIQADGQVKIIDFGLACRPGSVDTNFLFPGTLFYISPEQLHGEPVDERTDLYSLGITVYEMLTGQVPISGDDMKAVINWHLNEDLPDQHSVIPDLPDEFRTFLMKTVRKNPAARYRDVSEALDGLLPLTEKFGVNSQPRYCTQNKMIGMFLLYQEDQQMEMKRHIEEFNKKISETGSVLRVTPFE